MSYSRSSWSLIHLGRFISLSKKRRSSIIQIYLHIYYEETFPVPFVPYKTITTCSVLWSRPNNILIKMCAWPPLDCSFSPSLGLFLPHSESLSWHLNANLWCLEQCQVTYWHYFPEWVCLSATVHRSLPDRRNMCSCHLFNLLCENMLYST